MKNLSKNWNTWQQKLEKLGKKLEKLSKKLELGIKLEKLGNKIKNLENKHEILGKQLKTQQKLETHGKKT